LWGFDYFSYFMLLLVGRLSASANLGSSLISLLAARRKYHSGDSIIHIFLFASYSHNNAKQAAMFVVGAKAKASAERAALIPRVLRRIFLLSSINAIFS